MYSGCLGCPLGKSLISPSSCRFMSKDRSSRPPTSAVTFQRETTAIFISFLCCLMLFLSSKGAGGTMEAVPCPTGHATPLPHTLRLSWKNAFCSILLRLHPWSTVKHTGNTTSNSLPSLRINTWKLNMVHHEGKSWFHLFSWNRL